MSLFKKKGGDGRDGPADSTSAFKAAAGTEQLTPIERAIRDSRDCRNQGELAKARAIITPLLSADPEDVSLVMEAARIAYRLKNGSQEKAVHSFAKIATSRHEKITSDIKLEAGFYLTHYYAEKNDKGKAQEALKAMQALSPDSPFMHVGQTFLYSSLGQRDQAKQALAQCTDCPDTGFIASIYNDLVLELSNASPPQQTDCPPSHNGAPISLVEPTPGS